MTKLSMMMTGASALALAAFASVPAGAIQVAPDAGAANAPVTQVQFGGGDNRFGGQGGPSAGNRGPSGGSGYSGRGSGGPGPAISGRGQGAPSFSGRSGPSRGDVQRSVRGPSAPTVNRNFNNDGPRVSGRGYDGPRDGRRFDGRRDGHWDGRLVRRGWSRDHRYAFYGAVLVGVPLGYAMVADNPCYDWNYGPNGWGYYWNYYRCPV